MAPFSRGGRQMNNVHTIHEILFHDDELVLVVDETTYSFKLADISHKLFKAGTVERERYEVSPSGYGIHWPLLDEDLSIDALLGIRHCPSFMYREAA
jgi:hypothetical protein